MYLIHETLFNKTLRRLMPIHSLDTTNSKIKARKNSYYKHQDPFKLNYYARFSPNRKKIREEFLFNILRTSTPLTPRSNKSLAFSKRSINSSQCEPFAYEFKSQTYQQIDSINLPNLTLYPKQTSQGPTRNLDQAENEKYLEIQKYYRKVEDQTHQKKLLFDQNSIIKQQNTTKTLLNNLDLENLSKPQDNCFEQIIDSLSVDQSCNPGVELKVRNEMLIEEDDEDFEQEINKNFNQFYIQKQNFTIFEGNHSIKSLKLLNQNAVIPQQPKENPVKSQTGSFLIDSDLSLIEQKWNSIFETQINGVLQKQMLFENSLNQSNEAILNQQNVQQQNKKNQRKTSSSSEEDLPSFSYPNIPMQSPQQSFRFQTYEQKFQKMKEHYKRNQNQAKEFKRHFTFGYELNAAEKNQNQIGLERNQKNQVQTNQSHFINLINEENEIIQPFCLKFVSKNTLQSLNKKRSSKKSLQNRPNQQKKRPVANQQNKNSKKILNFGRNVQRQAKKTFINQKLIEIEDQEILQQNIILNSRNQIDNSLEIKIQEDDDLGERDPDFKQENQEQVRESTNEGQTWRQKQKWEEKNWKQKKKRRQNWERTMKLMIKKQQYQSRTFDQEQGPAIEEQEEHLSDLIVPTEYFQRRINSLCQIREHNQSGKSDQKRIDLKSKEKTGYASIYRARFHLSKINASQDKIKAITSNTSENLSSNAEQDAERVSNNQPKHSDIESLTTATEQFQTPIYSTNKKSKCIDEVQNLKKYLKKLQDNTQNNGKQERIITNFQINENNKQIEIERENAILNSKDDRLLLKEENHQMNQEQKYSSSLHSCENSQSKKGKIEIKSIIENRQKQFSFNLLTRQQSKYPQTLEQKDIPGSLMLQKPLTNVNKSLKMLENLIPTLPLEFLPLYQKIYGQVFERELMYKQKLTKQEFLLNFIQKLKQGLKEKINCEEFISNKLCQQKCGKDKKLGVEIEKCEKFQMLMNKYIILGLVRNLCGQD